MSEQQEDYCKDLFDLWCEFKGLTNDTIKKFQEFNISILDKLEKETNEDKKKELVKFLSLAGEMSRHALKVSRSVPSSKKIIRVK